MFAHSVEKLNSINKTDKKCLPPKNWGEIQLEKIMFVDSAVNLSHFKPLFTEEIMQISRDAL